jgi:hypothetical protein
MIVPAPFSRCDNEARHGCHVVVINDGASSSTREQQQWESLVSAPVNAVERVERALRARGGYRAAEVLRKRSRYLAGLSPYEMVQAPHGDRVVLAELENIVRQAGATVS